MKKQTYYLILGLGLNVKTVGPRTARKARQIVQRLVRDGHYIVCDKVTRTKKTYQSERVYRNRIDYYLNTLKA